jgi:hypothetical protein
VNDHSDAPKVRWQPADRAERRIVFEPTSAGDWTRLEQVRSDIDGVGWQTVGSERCDGIGFEGVSPEYVDGHSATVEGP